MTNSPFSLEKVSDLLQVISPEVRLEILLAIGEGEAWKQVSVTGKHISPSI
jgi:hypothetical protein